MDLDQTSRLIGETKPWGERYRERLLLAQLSCTLIKSNLIHDDINGAPGSGIQNPEEISGKKVCKGTCSTALYSGFRC